MKHKWILAVAMIAVVALLVAMFSGFSPTNIHLLNSKPVVSISYPSSGASVWGLVMISGTASDPDGNVNSVEVKIGDGEWVGADGTLLWSFTWDTYGYENSRFTISARSWDGKDYSDVRTITVSVGNPAESDSGSHNYAIFIAAANFPADNESKLGNGGLFLAEDMAAYLIKNCQYATSHITILFDDGWIRSDNGYGAKEKTLQQRPHEYNIMYGGATKTNVMNAFERLINQSNSYEDSEVFIWVFNHGAGDLENGLTGGKLLKSSEIFLWDDTLSDKELGDILSPLESSKVTLLIDACYAGGFADRTIFNLRTSLFFRSGIPENGRVVIAGTSKFRSGFASTAQGPIFTLLWFEGLSTGSADGFRPGVLDLGKPGVLKLFQDGKVSVEEAFYYARYMLRTDENLKDFRSMQPQINDQYPHRGVLRSRGGLVLGSD
jgi:hypothetical protein